MVMVMSTLVTAVWRRRRWSWRNRAAAAALRSQEQQQEWEQRGRHQSSKSSARVAAGAHDDVIIVVQLRKASEAAEAQWEDGGDGTAHTRLLGGRLLVPLRMLVLWSVPAHFLLGLLAFSLLLQLDVGRGGAHASLQKAKDDAVSVFPRGCMQATRLEK